MYPSFQTLELVGNCQGARGDFTSAAATYERAWDMDQSRPMALALRGWALLKSGALPEGRSAIDLAHQLPFADEVERERLAEMFREHDLPDDARREQDIILKTGQFLSSEICRENQLRGDDAKAHGDYAAAAIDWDLAFLRNLTEKTHFLVPIGNVNAPAMIHRARAMALIATEPARAMVEAKIAVVDAPQEVDGLIDMVLAFDKSGHKAAADAIYSAAMSVYRNLCQSFPVSAPANNLLSWAEGRCHRDLDDALRHAKTAVEREPGNADYIDTLGEVYLQMGQYDLALAQANRCIEIGSNNTHYREQIIRIKAAGEASHVPASAPSH